MEKWRQVPGFACYEVSSLGRVRSVRYLKPVKKTTGRKQRHLFVVLQKNNGTRLFTGIHRLMLLAFKGSPPKGKTLACHKDDNPRNNVLSNLKWADYFQNYRDSVINKRGVGSPKLNFTKVRKIRELLSQGKTQKEIAKKFLVCEATISFIRRMKTWRE